MKLTRDDVQKIDLEPLRPMSAGEEFTDRKQHYRLLAHLSTRVSGTIIDIGTHLGN